MTPTRDKLRTGPQLDTGTGSPVAPRPNIWDGGPSDESHDTGVASAPAQRPEGFNGDAFIPPLWL